jgi:osmotically-inducible protein OsmY
MLRHLTLGTRNKSPQEWSMRFMARMTALGMLIAAIALAGGCQGYQTGQSRTAGEITDDVTIQSIVKVGLLNDPDIKGLNINTSVHRGVVTLTGRVASADLKRRAIAIAGSAKGVKSVDDRLSIVTE